MDALFLIQSSVKQWQELRTLDQLLSFPVLFLGLTVAVETGWDSVKDYYLLI